MTNIFDDLLSGVVESWGRDLKVEHVLGASIETGGFYRSIECEGWELKETIKSGNSDSVCQANYSAPLGAVFFSSQRHTDLSFAHFKKHFPGPVLLGCLPLLMEACSHCVHTLVAALCMENYIKVVSGVLSGYDDYTKRLESFDAGGPRAAVDFMELLDVRVRVGHQYWCAEGMLSDFSDMLHDLRSLVQGALSWHDFMAVSVLKDLVDLGLFAVGIESDHTRARALYLTERTICTITRKKLSCPT